MKKTLILFILVIIVTVNYNFSQSYNTINFSGNVNAFNDAERKYVGDNTRYYITYDETYIYALANRYNGQSFGEYDHFNIYFDTDPQSDLTSGNGSQTGVNWDNNTPTLPFNADYRITIRSNGSSSWLHHYNGSSWVDQNVNYTEWVDSNDLFIRIPIADLGNPDAIYFVAYMSWGSNDGSGGFFGASNSGYVTTISGSTISGYYGGIGLLSSGTTMWSNSNTPIGPFHNIVFLFSRKFDESLNF